MDSAERALRRAVESVGRPPGTIVPPQGAVPPRITVTLYDRDRHEVRDGVAVDSLASLPADRRVVWVDVVGIGDQRVLEKLIDVFGIPWLAVEDVVHSPQRPKVDAYDDARFIVVRMFDKPGTCDLDQFSMFVRKNVLVTFQERPGDPFDPIRKRLAANDSQIRRHGADYLVYRLVDACVDSMFPEVQRLSDDVERLEEKAMERPTTRLFHELHSLRRELRVLERVSVGTRDAIASLARDEEGFFKPATRPFLRDVLDHASQIVELSHYYTSATNDIGNLVIGTLDLRMNQAMKVLAAVTVVFMPLTLIAGVYGMNFENMPELGTRWGYFVVLGIMVAVGAGLWIWMRRLGWTKADNL
jgi:magnesium transporter